MARDLDGALRTRVAGIGLEVVSLGIRDVVLPGDMKELTNKVIEVQKAAEKGRLSVVVGEGGLAGRVVKLV